jgi:hypothetical protein
VDRDLVIRHARPVISNSTTVFVIQLVTELITLPYQWHCSVPIGTESHPWLKQTFAAFLCASEFCIPVLNGQWEHSEICKWPLMTAVGNYWSLSYLPSDISWLSKIIIFTRCCIIQMFFENRVVNARPIHLWDIGICCVSGINVEDWIIGFPKRKMDTRKWWSPLTPNDVSINVLVDSSLSSLKTHLMHRRFW